MNNKIILILIILVGFILRVTNISNNPPSLYGDELTITLDAYSLLKTGQDQLGNPFPLTFQMGAGRPAGYVYGSIPFISIFGPTALGVRGLSIISGLGIIILLFYIGRKLFSEKAGLIASFTVSISIWDISLSRGGFEAHFALFLAVLGFYFFLNAKEKPLFYIFSSLSFGLTLHTYPTYKVALPLFLLLLFWFRGKNILGNAKKLLPPALLILLFLGLLSFSQTFIGGSETRFSDINTISRQDLKTSIEQKINYERSVTILPESLSKLLHNKAVEYSKVLIENYLQNFSIDFLFIHGDRNPRHNMATMGELYAVELILILAGLLTFWTKYKKAIIFLISWALLAPIPTATVDLPHALRSAFMLPPLILLSSLGLFTILNRKNRVLLILIAIIFFVQFIFFIQKLFFLSPNLYSKFWSYPAKQASEIAKENINHFDFIILSDKIDNVEFAYPVYAKVHPTEVINQNKNRASFMDHKSKNFGRVIIGNFPGDRARDLLSRSHESILYIGIPEEAVNFTDYQILQGLDKMPSILVVKKNE